MVCGIWDYPRARKEALRRRVLCGAGALFSTQFFVWRTSRRTFFVRTIFMRESVSSDGKEVLGANAGFWWAGVGLRAEKLREWVELLGTDALVKGDRG